MIAAGGAVMLVPLVYSLIIGDGTAHAFVIPAFAALLFGGGAFYFARVPSTYVSGGTFT